MTNQIPHSSILHLPALDGACGIQLIISGAAGRMHSSALAAYGAKCVGAEDMLTVTKQSLRSPNERLKGTTTLNTETCLQHNCFKQCNREPETV